VKHKQKAKEAGQQGSAVEGRGEEATDQPGETVEEGQDDEEPHEDGQVKVQEAAQDGHCMQGEQPRPSRHDIQQGHPPSLSVGSGCFVGAERGGWGERDEPVTKSAPDRPTSMTLIT